MAKKTVKFEHNPGMMMVLTYLVLLAVNVLVMWLASQWFPQYIVLGTVSLTATWALWISMGKLTLFEFLLMPLFAEWEHKRGTKLTPGEWMGGYLVLNFVGLWLVTRFSAQFGLGVTSWLVVAALAFVLDMVQGMAMMKLEKWRVS